MAQNLGITSDATTRCLTLVRLTSLQGNLEAQNGLPVSPYMDEKEENQPQMSLNFIDFIVAPLILTMTNAMPELATVDIL